MSLIFPSNPTLNQTYQSGNSATYKWNGTFWEISAPGPLTGLTVGTASYAERVVWMQTTPPPTGTGSLWYDADTGNMYVKYDAAWVPAQSTIGNAVSASFVRSASFASTAAAVNTLNQAVTVSGSFTVFTGSNVELQVTNTGVRLGNQLTDRHQATGSLNVTGSIVLNGATITTGSSVPLWVGAGGMIIGATTTAPTFTSTNRNESFYRQLGARQWEVIYAFDKPTGFATNGSGDYLVSLPTACPDFQNFGIQPFWTGNAGESQPWFQTFALAQSYGSAFHNILPSTTVQVVIYDARRFRVLIHVPGNSIRFWGQPWYPMDGNMGLMLRFQYQSV